MSERPRIALLGMPRTGKSTYLGALWALVQSHLEPSVSEASFSGDRAYVQILAEQVARAEEVPRTAIDASDQLAVALRFDPGATVDLLMPDTSGESLRLLSEERVWYPRLRSVCEEATAILLFIHPERVRVPQPLAVLTGVVGDSIEEESPAERVPFYAREHASTAAELIEVFENVAEVCRSRWPIRLAVVVSAWDTVDDGSAPTPYTWMETRLPGLLSTIECNPQIAELGVFGVSAQGGALADREGLLARGEVYDRAFARNAQGEPVSLAEPVRWAIWGS